MRAKSTETPAGRVDRRVRKTKRQLSEALLQLILEKGYEHVTVEDILRRADVGRSTFYTHYESKDMLLVDGPRNLGFTLFSEAADSQRHPMSFYALFEHVGQHRALAKAMLGKASGGLMMEAFRAQVATAIRNFYQAPKRARAHEGRSFHYLTEAASSAVGSLIGTWVDRDFETAVDEVSSFCQQAVEGMLGQRRA
jgi:AcrR family transcriptional regulator